MARIDVIMPQMGESITEGTMSRWIKQVGDAVKRDEPIFEISTDKVDAEIPAPNAGILVEILVTEGQTVAVGTIVARIETGAAAARRRPPAPPATAGARCRRRRRSPPRRRPRPHRAAPAAPTPAPTAPAAAQVRGDREQRLQRKSTPLVRKMVEEHGLDLGAIPGTGSAGRVTKTRRARASSRSGPRPRRPLRRPPPPLPSAAAPSAPAAPPRRVAPAAGRRGLGRRSRRTVGTGPQADRRSHDHVAARLGARELADGNRLHPRGRHPEAAQGRVRRAGRQPHVPRLHREGDRRQPPQAPGGQRRHLRRQHHLPPRHQHRHRRGARLGPDRPGDQARRRAVAARRRAARFRTSPSARAPRSSRPTTSRRAPSRSPIPAASGPTSARRSSTSRRWRSWPLARSRSGPP